MADRNNVVMEGVRIVFRNFLGKEDKYNKAGVRNFCVVLAEEDAVPMEADQWNIKWFKPREDDEPGVRVAYLPVVLEYEKGRPPTVVLITSRGRTHLGEQEVEMLQYADIVNVDLIVNPFPWEVNGKSGIKAYLKSMYVTIEEDALEKKYGLGDE